ncbi:MAG: sugar ABC transporter ATP-binding protein [Hyphomicrobiales bacterium]|nr:sugar ABC transporter ATP-binding protein [Hyphomicrobiales bacterium]
MAEILSANSICKSYQGVAALHDVSFSLARGEIRALCGENGAGKSTFVKILMGITQPERGTIAVAGEAHVVRDPQHAQALGLGLVAQELSLAPHLSILDNIWLGSAEVPFLHRRSALRVRARKALAALGREDWDLDRPVGSLTIGQRQLVEIARLLARDARVLILDEPTATLSDADIESILGILKDLRAQGRSIIYITHRLGEVFEICDSVTVLRNGRHVATEPVGAVTRTGLVELMLGRSFADMYPEAAERTAEGARVVVEDLEVPGVLSGFSMVAPRGRILCITGQIGSGANMVTRALAGLVPSASGSVAIDGQRMPLGSAPRRAARNVLFIPDDRASEGLFPEMTVRDNLVAASLGAATRMGLLSWPALRRMSARLAERVGVDGHRLESRAIALSGGNQQKLLFGRALASGDPGVLLMNEPTRGIDVGARAEIYRIMRELCDHGAALIMTSSDLEEVVGIADIVLTLYRGRMVARYEGADITMSAILADITHPVAGAA